MMQVLTAILPVITMIGLGILCRKMKWLTRSGVDQLKFLVTKIILPVAILNALSTADYSSQTALLVGIMLAMLVVSFAIGFLLQPLVPAPFSKYVPFMVSIYEGGMMAYPLYASLCGAENLSHIAVLDIAALLFGFSVYMGMLTQVETGGKPDWRKLLTDALRNPAFIAAALGVLFGLTGWIKTLCASAFGSLYTDTVSMVTSALSAMILLIVGYDLKPEKAVLSPCLKTIALRFTLQALMIAGVLLIVRSFVTADPLVTSAILIYMATPATFSMQSFLKNEQGSRYAATTNSLYCLVTLAVYAAAVAVL